MFLVRIISLVGEPLRTGKNKLEKSSFKKSSPCHRSSVIDAGNFLCNKKNHDTMALQQKSPKKVGKCRNENTVHI